MLGSGRVAGFDPQQDLRDITHDGSHGDDGLNLFLASYSGRIAANRLRVICCTRGSGPLGVV